VIEGWKLGCKGDAAVVSKECDVHGITKRFHVVRIWIGRGEIVPSGNEYSTVVDPDDCLAWALVPRSHLQVLGAEETSGTIRVGDVVVVSVLDGESGGYYIVQSVLHAA
jgi:hypothetical protein